MDRNAFVSAAETGSTSSSRRWNADPARHGGRGDPQRGERNRSPTRPEAAATATVSSTAKATRTLATMRPYVARELQVDRVLGLRRRDPLQQIPAREEQTDQRAHNCVRHQPRLVREKCDRQTDLRCAQRQIGKNVAEMAAFGNAAQPGIQSNEKRNQRGNGDGGQNETRSTPRETPAASASPRPAAAACTAPKECGADYQSSSNG